MKIGFVVAIAATACASGHSASQKDAEPPVSREASPATARPQSGAQASATVPAPDHSLTSAQYFALGMPAIDRMWQGDDLTKAYQVIARLADEDPLELPRRGSSNSGAVFGRIVSGENVALANDGRYPLPLRLQIASKQAQPLGQMTQAYLKAHMAQKGSFMPELVDLTCATSFVSRTVSALALAVKPPPEGSERRMQFDKGLQQMQHGLATEVRGIFITLSDKTSVLEADRVRLAGCIARDLPRMMAMLSPLSREEAKRQVQEALKGETSAGVKAELSLLSTDLEAFDSKQQSAR
jgi:hypothetical protein